MVESGIDWSAPSYEALVERHRWQIPARLNIATLACRRHADGSGRLALVCHDEEREVSRHHFDELEDLSARFAYGLRSLGVGRGDRIAVFLPQRLENAVAHLASFRLGAVSVPLSPLFRADALGHRLADSGARVLVTDAEHAPFLEGVSGLPAVVTCERDWGALTRARLPEDVDTRADDPAILLYTSGTTGMPRGALHAHRFLVGRFAGIELMHRLASRPSTDRPFWTPADWAWVAGLMDSVFTPWAFGCPVLAWRRRRFDPEAALRLLSSARVRAAFLPPTALNLLRRAAPTRLPGVTIHTAGEPLSAEVHAWASGLFDEVWELYGMTEMGALVGTSPFVPVRPGSMGKPFPGHVVELHDEEGRPTDEGEIVVRRPDPGMFLGYWKAPEADAARFRGEWLRTGDLARRDADGYLWYQGRADDMFNASGYRVGPTEIERCLERHPAVERAAVVGAPDGERGHVVKAFLVLRAGFSAGPALAASIQEHVKSALAAYEYPRQIVFARELPMTVTGKVQRSALREAGADERWAVSPEKSTP